MNFIGVDPGVSIAIAVLNRYGFIQSEVLTVSPIDLTGNVARHLAQLGQYNEIDQAIRHFLLTSDYAPKSTLVFLEGVSYGSKFNVGKMAVINYLILNAAVQLHYPVVIYQPNHVKKIITGAGRADKSVVKRYIKEANLDVPEPVFTNHNLVDALAIALCGRLEYEQQQTTEAIKDKRLSPKSNPK